MAIRESQAGRVNFLVLILLILWAPRLTAGDEQLHDFESEAVKKGSTSIRPEEVDLSRKEKKEEEPGFFEELFSDVVGDGLVAGGADAWIRTSAKLSLAPPPEVVPREWGESTVPLARVEVGFQSLEGDVTARDVQGEIGFGPFAFQARKTYFEEKSPATTLDLTQWHILYRMTATRHFELDLGFGNGILKGINHNSGFSFSLPVRIQTTRWLGFEFRPSWTSFGENSVGDYDLRVSLSKGLLALDAGYRWTRAGTEQLKGPRFGIGTRF